MGDRVLRGWRLWEKLKHTPPRPWCSSIWIVANTAGCEGGGGSSHSLSCVGAKVWKESGGTVGTGGGPWGWALERGAVQAAGQAGEGPAGIQRER